MNYRKGYVICLAKMDMREKADIVVKSVQKDMTKTKPHVKDPWTYTADVRIFAKLEKFLIKTHVLMECEMMEQAVGWIPMDEVRGLLQRKKTALQVHAMMERVVTVTHMFLDVFVQQVGMVIVAKMKQKNVKVIAERVL
jgi:hypothetical protein